MKSHVYTSPRAPWKMRFLQPSAASSYIAVMVKVRVFAFMGP